VSIDVNLLLVDATMPKASAAVAARWEPITAAKRATGVTSPGKSNHVDDILNS
jgi:hypothetical protein